MKETTRKMEYTTEQALYLAFELSRVSFISVGDFEAVDGGYVAKWK
jgi:hypothetical protein